MSTSADRIAKAWRVRPIWSEESDIVHAPTASKARYSAVLAWEIEDMQFSKVLVHRAAEHDLRLPVPHRLVDELSAEDRSVVLNAYGTRNRRNLGYRDHFCTAPGDMRMLRLAWELGLFRGPYGEAEYGSSPGWAGAFFYLTELGRHVARSMVPTYG